MILQLAINGILIGGLYAMISVGLTLIFGVMRIVNFAHGEFLMLGMYAAFWGFRCLGIDPFMTALFLIPIFFILGVAIQRLIIRPILYASNVAKFFVTVGLSVLLQNLALFLWSADYRAIRTSYVQSVIQIGGLYIGTIRLLSFGATILMYGLLLLFLKRTYIGKAMRATVQDPNTAVLLGIDVRKIHALAFGIGITYVGVAGAFLVPIYQVFPTVGLNFVLAAFVVVVLGGMGNVLGAFIGGLIVGLVESFSGFFIGTGMKEATYYLIFILILLIRPSGLLGARGSE
jgi:branched-chain amino acid transport system permease protein